MLRIVLMAWMTLALVSATAGEFLAGADMSHLKFFEDRGIVYRTNGQPRDAFETLSERGLNSVRLRLFTSSAAQAASDPYNHINNLDYTLPLAVRVKDAGLKFLLDFHYSDTWADPGHQAKPAAWASLTFPQLEQRMYDYSSNTIAAFKAAGAMPDYVQVGNEIPGGMLWDDGRVSGSNNESWSNLGRLLKAAINGIMDAAGATPPKIIIHIDKGGNWSTTQWYFDNIEDQQVPYDIIGQSFYPWWHGDLDDLRTCLNNSANRYGKPIIIAETAYPWTNSVWDDPPGLNIPASTTGQVEFVTELAKILKSVPDGKGMGIFWWGSEYVQLSGANLAGFQRRSFFDYNGNALPVIAALGQLTAEVTLNAQVEGVSLRLEWPLSGAGMSLMTTTSPAPTSIWVDVTNSVDSTGGIFSVSLPLNPTPNGFYRLEVD